MPIEVRLARDGPVGRHAAAPSSLCCCLPAASIARCMWQQPCPSPTPLLTFWHKASHCIPHAAPCTPHLELLQHQGADARVLAGLGVLAAAQLEAHGGAALGLVVGEGRLIGSEF